MIDPIYVDATIYSSLLTLLSIGLTLTYLTTKVPNFAHTTFATFGAYVALTVVSIWGSNIYYHLYLSLFFGGLIALAQYLIVFRPLMRRGASVVALMITTLAMEFILLAVLNVYADYLSRVFKIRSRYFLLKSYDIIIAEQRGLLFVAPALAIATVILIHLVLTRTKFGVAMRAAIEDASLASVMGINVNLVYAVSWFIAGALSGLSGMLIPLYSMCNPDVGAWWTVSVFSASITGGLLSVYGAIIGGFLIGFAEIIGTSRLAVEVGVWVVPYRHLIPLFAIVVTLFLAPKGLLGVDWRGLTMKTWAKSVGFIRFPKKSFDEVGDEAWKNSFNHFLKLLVVFAAFQTFILTYTYPILKPLVTGLIPITLKPVWPALAGFFYIILGGLIILSSISLLTHSVIYILGGRKRIGQTLKSIMYGSTSSLLLGWIPFLGIAFAVWSLAVAAKGIQQLHGISLVKAAATIITAAVATLLLLTSLLVPVSTFILG